MSRTPQKDFSAYEKLVWAVVTAKLVKNAPLGPGWEMLPIRPEDIDRIDQTLQLLDQKYRSIIQMDFGIGRRKLSAREIANKIGTGTSNFYKLRARVLRMLRHPTRNCAFRRLFRFGLEEIINKQSRRIQELEQEVSKLRSEQEWQQIEENRRALFGTRANTFYDFSVETLEFSVRVESRLDDLGVETIGDLLKKTEQELVACHGFGRKCLNEVKGVLGLLGLSLKS
jgi:hypothetical protein